LESAEIIDGRVHLLFHKPDGTREKCIVDHVVAGTGYRPDLAKLPFLPETLRRQITTVGTAPALDTYFQSSVKGLYFVGPIAAPSFGPLLRFVYGGGFTCKRLMKALPKTVRSHAAAVAVRA
jgi:NADPH-dependent 2,4-dienoyl-CoA reductase/sulfur reductase-like enzyme